MEEQEILKTSLVKEANRARKKVSDNHRRALYGERGRTPWDSVLDEPAIQNLLKVVRTKDVAINSSDIPRIPGGPADQHTRINLPRIGMGFGSVCRDGNGSLSTIPNDFHAVACFALYISIHIRLVPWEWRAFFHNLGKCLETLGKHLGKMLSTCFDPRCAIGAPWPTDTAGAMISVKALLERHSESRRG